MNAKWQSTISGMQSISVSSMKVMFFLLQPLSFSLTMKFHISNMLPEDAVLLGRDQTLSSSKSKILVVTHCILCTIAQTKILLQNIQIHMN